MKKDVLIRISGMQSDIYKDADKIEIITSGSYYKKNNKHYLMYDEIGENKDEVTKNIARFDDEEFHIQKSGYTNVNMSFEENKRNIANYITPYGSLLVGIDASKVDVIENDEDIQVDISYSLDVNYEHMADCRLHMDIISRSGEDTFPLTQ